MTSLLCMPNTNPTVDNADTVQYILDKAQNADARVYVAASITKGLKSEEPTDLEELKAAGAIGLSDDGRPVENTKFLSNAMKKAPSLGMTVVAHCEDLFLANGGKINEGEVSRQLGIKGIPASAEDCGTAREIALAAAENVPIHICQNQRGAGARRQAQRGEGHGGNRAALFHPHRKGIAKARRGLPHESAAAHGRRRQGDYRGLA